MTHWSDRLKLSSTNYPPSLRSFTKQNNINKICKYYTWKLSSFNSNNNNRKQEPFCFYHVFHSPSIYSEYAHLDEFGFVCFSLAWANICPICHFKLLTRHLVHLCPIWPLERCQKSKLSYQNRHKRSELSPTRHTLNKPFPKAIKPNKTKWNALSKKWQ